jgi:hypothetical protein
VVFVSRTHGKKRRQKSNGDLGPKTVNTQPDQNQWSNGDSWNRAEDDEGRLDGKPEKSGVNNSKARTDADDGSDKET